MVKRILANILRIDAPVTPTHSDSVIESGVIGGVGVAVDLNVTGNAFQHLGNLVVCQVVYWMHFDAGALLALLVGHLTHISINFVDGQARPSLKIPAVLDLHRPLITCGKPYVLQCLAAVSAVTVVHQLPKLDGIVNAGIIHGHSSIHPAACGLGNRLGFAFVRFPNHKPNVSKGISAVAVMVVQGVTAELSCVWIYLVAVMAQTS